MISNMASVVSTLLLGFIVIFSEEVITEAVIRPVNVTVSENQAATLTCTLTGSSEAVNYFTWSYKRSSEELENNVGILTSTCKSVVIPINTSLYEYACPGNTQSTWTIKKVTRQNHGDRYKCNIETSSGNENSEYTFIQIQVVKTEIVIAPVNMTVSENQAATLTCTLTGTSEAVNYFTWSYKRSSEDEANVGILTSTCKSVIIPINTSLYEYACPSNTMSTWTIKKVTRQNHGDRYKCSIEDKDSEYTFIQIQVPVSSVTMIVPSSESVTVNQNESKEFKCKTSGGLPAATVSWYKDSGTPGDSSDDVEITSNIVTSSSSINYLIEVTSTLTYSPSKIDNGWRIYCTASNIIGQTPIVSTRKPLLNVQYPPDGPPVITGYNDGGEYHVVAGSQGQLSCSVSGGNPSPTLTWSCINNGSPQTINSSTVTRLHTWIAKRGQDRTCTCIASHYSGNKDVSIRIITLSVPQTLQLDSPPTQDQDLAENAVTLGCITGCSYPQPSLKWFYTEFGGSRKEWSSPGADTSTTGGCTYSDKIYTSTLSLAKYSTFPGNLNKTVKFTCGIPTFPGMAQPLYTNPSVNIHFAVQVINVTVKDGDDIVSEYLQVKSGFSTTLTCTPSVSRPAATIIWYIGTEERQRTSSNSTFTFLPQKSDNNKLIFCKAFNLQPEEQAVISNKTMLNVLDTSITQTFYIEGHINQQNVTVDEHDAEIQFKCIVNSNPKFHIRILFEKDVLVEQVNESSLSFFRRDVSCLDAGVYTCEGSNGFGRKSTHNITLFVQCSPRPLRQIERNASSYLYSVVMLSVSVIAYPPPGTKGFSWSKEESERWLPLLSNTDLKISSSSLLSNLTLLNISRGDFGLYRVIVTNTIGSYEQHIFLSEKKEEHQTDGQCMRQTSETTALIVGLILGALCCIVVIYATYITVLKNRLLKKVTSLLDRSGNESRYANPTFASNVTEVEGYDGNTKSDQEASVQQYTDLSRYANTDTNTYDVINKT